MIIDDLGIMGVHPSVTLKLTHAWASIPIRSALIKNRTFISCMHHVFRPHLMQRACMSLMWLLLPSVMGISTITNCIELQAMQNNLTEAYELGANIDCSETVNWNRGLGFEPIGDTLDPFVGTLDGRGYNITNLFIYRPLWIDVGLLGCAGLNAVITSIGLLDMSLVGGYYVGGLVGYNDGTIKDTRVTGSVSGNLDLAFVGGLVGFNAGTINHAVAMGFVSSDAYLVDVGGLVGYNGGTISDATATSTVSSNGNNACVGGLVGRTGINDNEAPINHVIATGSVLGDGDNANVGGLAGCNEGIINDATATSTVSGNGLAADVGGLVGQNAGTINHAIAMGPVSGKGLDASVGGLVGSNRGIINDVIATGTVSGDSDNAAVGGLVGYNSHNSITNAFTAGTTSGHGQSTDVGGLVGNNRGSLVNVSTTSSVFGSGNNGLVGGLVGYNRGSIVNASVVSSVMGNDHVGGLVGLNSGTIIHATATGPVSGNQTVGGLVGLNDVDGSITDAFTHNSVSGKNQVGGLAGVNQGNISIAYSLSQVTGQSVVGGLIGVNNGPSVMNVYVIGMVLGDRYVGGIAGNVGAFVGSMSSIYVSGCIDGQKFTGALVGGSFDSSIIYAVYWDKQVTLLDQASGGSANFDLRKNKKDTRDLYKKATYVGWDFNNAWMIDEGHSYPYLRALLPMALPIAPKTRCPHSTPYIWIFLHTILIPVGAALTGLVIAWFLAFHWYHRLTPRKKMNRVSDVLSILAKLGRLSLVKILCEQADDIDQNTVTLALIAATESGHQNVVSYLVERYHEPHQLGEQNKATAAQTACSRRYFSIAALLAPHETQFFDISRLDDFQNRLFFILNNYRYPWFTLWWLKKGGSNLNVLNFDHQTPVMVATRNKHFSEALLLTHSFGADVLMTNHRGETVINQLLEKHKVIEARQLLSANHVMDYYRVAYLYTLQQVKAGKIKDIDLSKLLLNDDDLLALAEACSTYRDIQSLNLSYNAITSSGVFYLIKIILRLQTQLKTLGLRHTLISSYDVQLLQSSLGVEVDLQVDERLTGKKSKSSTSYVPVFAKSYFETLNLRLTVLSLHLQRYHILVALSFLLEMVNKLFDFLLIESLWMNKQYDLAYVSIACLFAEILLGLYGFRTAHGNWFPHDWREGWRVLLLPIASPQLVHLEWGISFVNPQFARLKLANFCVDELLQTVIILIFFIRKGIKTIALIKLIFSLVTSIFFMIKLFYSAPVLREQFARWRQRHPWWVLDNKYQRQKTEEELR